MVTWVSLKNGMKASGAQNLVMNPLMGPIGTNWWVKLIFEILVPNHSPHNKLAYHWGEMELNSKNPK